MKGTCGIGHTRWATHGEPSQKNAHPHVSGNCTGSSSGAVENLVVGVHKGFIKNYAELKEKLLKNGYSFYSATDTEFLIKLVDYYYKKYKLGPVDAIAKTMVRVRGSYALEVMFKDYPGEVWVAKKDSPMIIGVADGESYVASDVPAILKYTKNVYYIQNHQMAQIKEGKVHFFDLSGDEVENELGEMGLSDEEIKEVEGVTVVACGSAWHVGMAGQYVMEDLAQIPVRVELASEFRYRKPLLGGNTLVIVISQSGETADSLAALRRAKEKGCKTYGRVQGQRSLSLCGNKLRKLRYRRFTLLI